MATDDFSMVYDTGFINRHAAGKGVWDEYLDMHYYINWDNIKSVARRILSQDDFKIFILRGERGLTYTEISDVLRIPNTTVYDNITKNIKKIRDFIQKSRIYWVYIDREKNNGFKEYVMAEKDLSKKNYAAMCCRCGNHLKGEGWLIGGKLYGGESDCNCSEFIIAEKGDEDTIKMKIYLA